MWLWVALCYVAVAESMDCDLSIDGKAYREETLVSGVESPSGLAVEFTNNILYFSYERNDMSFSAKLDLKAGVVSKIKELTGRCTFTVDQVRRHVHAGCEGDEVGRGTGLYQFDTNINRFVIAGEEEQSVNFVYFNDVLYCIDDSYLLHTFRKGHIAWINDIKSRVLGLVIDNHKDWVFFNYTGVFRQRFGAAEAIRYAGVDNPNTLAVDTRGYAYVCDNGWNAPAIYRLDEQTSSAIKLLDVLWCNSFTFDRDDNIIYSYGNKINRLIKC